LVHIIAARVYSNPVGVFFNTVIAGDVLTSGSPACRVWREFDKEEDCISRMALFPDTYVVAKSGFGLVDSIFVRQFRKRIFFEEALHVISVALAIALPPLLI
jgi:hypothetical protein